MMDAHRFREGMRLFAGGVTLVTTAVGERRSGLTATAVCSLSSDPPRLLACVNRHGGTYAMISESRCFTVNMLAVRHQALAARFAGRPLPDAADRFESGEWDTGTTGAPALRDALASFECRVSAVIDVNSHGIILGDVMEVRISAGAAPLVYVDREFVTALRLDQIGDLDCRIGQSMIAA
jgi:flavin reductase (DIM6/NTAB) family NADH-FMN oxidoreductase RutF